MRGYGTSVEILNEPLIVFEPEDCPEKDVLNTSPRLKLVVLKETAALSLKRQSLLGGQLGMAEYEGSAISVPIVPKVLSG
jgi:hypothetical protein